MFFSLLNILFVFFSLELHERVRQYCVFCYFNVYDRQTQLLANENDMRCAFFFLKCLERDPNALVDHKSTD